jgi:hypothetical protein
MSKQCPKCGAYSGNDWSQCGGECPMQMSPYYSPELFMQFKGIKPVKGLVQRSDYEKKKVKPNARIDRST